MENYAFCTRCGRRGMESEMHLLGDDELCTDCYDEEVANSQAILKGLKAEKAKKEEEETELKGVKRFIDEIIEFEDNNGSDVLAEKLRGFRRKVELLGSGKEIEGMAGEFWQIYNDIMEEECGDSYDDGKIEGKQEGYEDGYNEGYLIGYDEGRSDILRGM